MSIYLHGIKMKEENWSSIRISEEELRDLHETKNLVEKSIGKKIRLGEAISYALRQLKSGRFESVNLKELQEKIEVELRGVDFGYHPPSLRFYMEIDNRNTMGLQIRQINYRILTVGPYGFDYVPISVSKEVEFDAVEKRTLQLIIPMDYYLIDLLHSHYEDGGYLPMITLWTNFHFTLGTIGSRFTVTKEMRTELEPKRWKNRMQTWKARFPKIFREYKTDRQ